MRHHSQRIPGKNYRILAGKPLFHHILNTLLDVPEIDEVCVDTDSSLIKSSLEDSFPDVRILDRPEDLCADEISMNRIISYDTSLVKADYYLQTHSTNPLLKAETISNAIKTFQTQDLPPLFEENSCLYLFTKQSLKKYGHRIGSSPYLFEIDPDEAWDIDTSLDFKIVDCLMNNAGE
jgi:CMP-N-acetylneuraminic acid synthetase